MDDEVDGVAFAGKRRGNGIDEERHVVVDDLDRGARRAPAMLLKPRIDDAHLRLAGRARLGKAPERERGAIEVLGRAGENILGRYVPVELAQEARDVFTAI